LAWRPQPKEEIKMPFFQAADGTRLAYEDYGTGGPIMFVPGWALNADMWEYQVPFFAERGYRCVLPDRRGHGRSDRPPAGYDLDTRADDLAALIEHLDLREITLIAHSAGGGEVTRYLARHGERRVARVAFVAALLPFLKLTDDNPAGLPEAACEAAIAQFRKDRPKWFADRVQGYFATHLGNDVSPALIVNELRRCLSASPVATAQVWRSSFHADHRAALRATTIPVLIIHGAADQSAPIDLTGRRTAALLPGCRYKEYPTAGHGLYVTHAEQLNTDLLDFIKT
jgi:non-heme chloroperoxidase